MKLYLISQRDNNDYDTFSAVVVCAPDEETARQMHPSSGEKITDWEAANDVWCSSPELVKVKRIGIAEETLKTGAICSSFHAG